MKLQLSDDTLKRQLNAFKERMQPRLRRILAIATDGCTATAAVIRTVDGAHLEIEALSTSRALKFENVAEELLAGLKGQGISIPKQTILLSAYMLPAVLELPVAAARPLTAGQMLEMIRWELEPLLAQLSALWSIGSLLRGRGYLSDTQRQELLAEHRAALADMPRGGRLAAARFGELAIRKGFASKEQVEECLALQEELQASDAGILIGWYPDAVGPGRDPGQSAWLCAGINPATRTRWVDALEHLGQHVLWIYPLASASAPLTALSQLPLAVELHSLFGSCYRQKNGMVTALHYRQFIHAASSGNEALDLVQPLLKSDDTLLGVYPGKDWENTMTGVLKEQLPQEIVTIANHEALLLSEGTDTPAAMLAALAGASMHALGLVSPASAVRLAGSKPPPPLYLRPESWMGAAAALVLLAIGGFEFNYFIQQRTLMEKHQALTEQQTEFEARKNLIERSIQAEAEMQKNLAAAKAELDAVSLHLVFFDRALSRRGPFMETVVDALNDLINDELLLESVAETGWQQLEIQGFALNAEAVYRYARSLAREMGHFGIKLGDLDTNEAQGPLGLMGYHFSFALMKADEAGTR